MTYDITDGVYGAIAGFVACIVIYNLLAPYLIKLKLGQQVRDDGPKSHLNKSGTPTMGGVIFLSSLLIGSLMFLKNNMDISALLFITLSYGVIGFVDDYIKVVKKRSLGLKAKEKIIAQTLVTTIFLYYLVSTSSNLGIVYIPFGKGLSVKLGFLYIPFFYIMMVGTVNSVNLTDGLDGLASGTTILVTMFFGFSALYLKNDVFVISWVLSGSLAGFLLFNCNPAKIFMGDTGSLALGGFIAGITSILHLELFILIVGLVYVIETLSVIIQVGYFKLTKGKRVFKMAPYHHHLELKGHKEQKIVQSFYILTGMMCLVGYLAIQNIV